MDKKVLAKYLRLSLEDRDKPDFAESNSIYGQRNIIDNYIKQSTSLSSMDVIEFVDDGYTGTNFERPKIQELLELVRAGKINCIIVKDFSRFGRNYIEVGDYLEHIFPFLGVRFIAVNDNYDSDDHKGLTGGPDIALRNFMYERYSQELSKKVKDTMHMMMSKGRYVSHCPYGYMKPEGEKHRMVPDPQTAPIVREIFMMAISGKRTTEIAKELNSRQILTPMLYKKLSRKGMTNDAMWSHQAVLRIIKDYKYTGAMVTFKCENLTIRAKAQHRRKPEEYTIVEDMHKPIVSHEEFYAANDSIRKVRPTAPVKGDRRDRVYFCGHCGRRLRKTFGSDEYYSCATPMYIEGATCGDIRLVRSEIEGILLDSFRNHSEFLDLHDGDKKKDKSDDYIASEKDRCSEINRKLGSLEAERFSLYERYRSGDITKTEYLDKKAALSFTETELKEELQRLEARIESEVQAQKTRLEVTLAAESVLSVLEKSDDEILEELYDHIDKVIVYSNNDIHISWSFDSFFCESLP